MTHRLLLPLPPAFSTAGEGAGLYSVFTSEQDPNACCRGECNVVSQHPKLQAYVTQLEDFIRKTRLIQYPPDDFFLFLFHDGGGGGDAGPAAPGGENPLLHLDGSRVQPGEIHCMRELCDAFAKLFPAGDSFIDGLHNIIRAGPPAEAAACLKSFFDETKTLQMNRQKRAENDAASVTLRTGHDTPPLQRLETERQRRDRVMQAVLGHGIGKKKQHEVRVMSDTVADLVGCCNTASALRGAAGLLEPVQTVVNIGEGKGYVSRALALCDGLQVIGLDCNPAHKERASERTEFFFQGPLRIDAGQTKVLGRDMLNLMYEPRGHMATIASCVGPCVDWATLLRGHVRVRDAASPSSDVVPIMPTYHQQEQEEEEKKKSMVDNAARVQCRICGHITRRNAAAWIVTHTLRHLNCDDHSVWDAALPSRDTVNQWNCTLSVEAFAHRVAGAFFTDEVLYANGKVNSAAGPRCAKDKDGPPGNNAQGALCDVLHAYGLVADVHLSRGTRAEVLVPVKTKQQQLEVRGEAMGGGNDGLDADQCYYVKVLLTIVGYDGASNRHFVIFDDGTRKEAFTLLQHQHRESAEQLREKKFKREYNFIPAMDAWLMKLALLLSVVQPVLPNTPTVHVPDLRNTVMMGLHPCGDLGSDVCRLFLASASRGLLLVSCCWHALTNNGFPLSRELQRRGWKTEQLSLLLATQPLDMWANVSAVGHSTSARVLFYRGLLKIFWFRLQESWERDHPGRKACCCFVVAPHLEPSFLRRIAKIKDTLTLDVLYVEVCREYFPPETANQASHEGKRQHVCASCLAAQTEFMMAEENVTLAAQMGRMYLASHFASFIGLTVLRMWMCHLVEMLLLLDRVFYVSEMLQQDVRCCGSVVSLVPLFDGAISPRMYGILARRIPFGGVNGSAAHAVN